MGVDEQVQWLAQWKRAAVLLREQRTKELRNLTSFELWAAIEALLAIPVSTPLPEERVTHSGFVEMQKYLRQLRFQ